MTKAPRLIESASTDPYTNLAIEACLMRAVKPGEPILYLWQNERTVVIGRNQCASAECDVARLEADGGHLARRESGGGAVYHDLGNLNFTFVTTAEEYDQQAQDGVILDAVRALGIPAERTGRNDLVVGGDRKFSGHAYRHTAWASCHHGTIMVAVDVEALGRYLTVSPLKLRAKGVHSVRSRVTNLCALRPETSVGEVKDALSQAFSYAAGSLVFVDPNELDQDELADARRHFAAREWLFRGERRFDESRQARYGWGSVLVELTAGDGVIRDLAIFSDSLETERFDMVPQLLVGAPCLADELERRLAAGGFARGMAADISRLIAGEAERPARTHALGEEPYHDL